MMATQLHPSTSFLVGEAYTTYFVSIVYQNRIDITRFTLVARILHVSGRSPLSREEALARARGLIKAEWKETECGAFSDWPELINLVCWNVVTSGPGG